MGAAAVFEAFDAGWAACHEVAVEGYILFGVLGFVWGMFIALLISGHNPFKKNKK